MPSRKYSGNKTIGAAYSCLCDKAQAQYANRRISADLSRRGFVTGIAASMLSLVLPGLSNAQSAIPPGAPPKPIIFTNFRLFDGKSAALRDGLFMVVEGNSISQLGQGQPPSSEGKTVVDCRGMVMMPGLIDMHWHSLLAALPIAAILQSEMAFVHLAASAEAERTLMRGFTTIRDAGGPAFAAR